MWDAVLHDNNAISRGAEGGLQMHPTQECVTYRCDASFNYANHCSRIWIFGVPFDAQNIKNATWSLRTYFFQTH